MRLPGFLRPQRRESVTNKLINAAVAQASGFPMPNPADSAGAQIAANLFSSALSGASIKSQVEFPPDFLYSLARELILRGEACYAIEADRSLTPVSMWDISGNANPASWVFRCDISGPSGVMTRTIPYEGVCLFTWQTKPSARWKGISPLEAAKGMSDLASRSARTMANEFNAAHLYVLALERDTRTEGDFQVDSDFNDIKNTSNGSTATVTFDHQSGWQQDKRAEYLRQERFGPTVADQNNLLASKWAQIEICQICGIPSSLVTDAADAGSRREGLRAFVDLSLRPLSKRISAELERGLETSVEIDLSPIIAGDVVSRSRAFGSLVKGGMDIEKAARISGVLAEDNE